METWPKIPSIEAPDDFVFPPAFGRGEGVALSQPYRREGWVNQLFPERYSEANHIVCVTTTNEEYQGPPTIDTFQTDFIPPASANMGGEWFSFDRVYDLYPQPEDWGDYSNIPLEQETKSEVISFDYYTTNAPQKTGQYMPSGTRDGQSWWYSCTHIIIDPDAIYRFMWVIFYRIRYYKTQGCHKTLASLSEFEPSLVNIVGAGLFGLLALGAVRADPTIQQPDRIIL